MTKPRVSHPRVFRLVVAALGARACSQSTFPNCSTGEACWLLPAADVCAPFCECSLIDDCSNPLACPSTLCPDAGSENFCPQGLVCMPAIPCETCGVACPVTFACLPPGSG